MRSKTKLISYLLVALGLNYQGKMSFVDPISKPSQTEEERQHRLAEAKRRRLRKRQKCLKNHQTIKEDLT